MQSCYVFLDEVSFFKALHSEPWQNSVGIPRLSESSEILCIHNDFTVFIVSYIVNFAIHYLVYDTVDTCLNVIPYIVWFTILNHEKKERKRKHLVFW